MWSSRSILKVPELGTLVSGVYSSLFESVAVRLVPEGAVVYKYMDREDSREGREGDLLADIVGQNEGLEIFGSVGHGALYASVRGTEVGSQRKAVGGGILGLGGELCTTPWHNQPLFSQCSAFRG